MSEPWLGLHNPERHHREREVEWVDYDCSYCGECDADDPCRCCLVSEVEALRAQVQRVRDAVALYDGGMLRGADLLYILDGGDA